MQVTYLLLLFDFFMIFLAFYLIYFGVKGTRQSANIEKCS